MQGGLETAGKLAYNGNNRTEARLRFREKRGEGGAAMLEKIDLSKKADKETCRQVMEQVQMYTGQQKLECAGKLADLDALAKLQETELAQDEETRAALETAECFYGAAELDQKIVDALIEKVMVYDPRHVEIRWKFSDEVIKRILD